MLANEVTRAETINLRAINYWHHHVIPDPPRRSPLTEQRRESAIARRMGLFVNLSSDTSSNMKPTQDRPRAIHQHHHQHRSQISPYDRFTMGEHDNLS